MKTRSGLELAHLGGDAGELLRGAGNLQLQDHLAAGLRHVLLQLLLNRLAGGIVDIDQGDLLEAPLLHEVGRHYPDLEVHQRNHVPEVVAELSEIRADAAAVDADHLGLVADRRDRLGHAREGREDERHLLDVDELGHGDDALLGRGLAVLELDDELLRQRLVGIGVLGREVGGSAEQLAVFGIGPAHRQVGANLDGILRGDGGNAKKRRGRQGEKANYAHAFPRFGCLMLVLGAVVPRQMKAHRSTAGNAVQRRDSRAALPSMGAAANTQPARASPANGVPRDDTVGSCSPSSRQRPFSRSPPPAAPASGHEPELLRICDPARSSENFQAVQTAGFGTTRKFFALQ